MRRSQRVAGVLAAAVLLPASLGAQWYDNFDSYNPGDLAAQSQWEEWTGSSGVDARVHPGQDFTPSFSARFQKNDDVVYRFAQLSGGEPTSGTWISSIKTYCPSGVDGLHYYIMLNQYPSNLNWSVTVVFDSSADTVNDWNGASLPLIEDQWVSLYVCIDLDADRYDIYYGDQLLVGNASWKEAISGGGIASIACVDLYVDDTGNEVWFDDARLEDVGKGDHLVLNATPNPIAGGTNITLKTQSQMLSGGEVGALFLWTANGVLFPLPLLYFTIGASGDWSITAPVPTGLSGLNTGFKTMVIPSSGPLMLSNEELVLYL